MKVEPFTIEGPLLFTPNLIKDDRGFFYESWNAKNFADALGLDPEVTPVFQQDNHSQSQRGVLRGLHYQLPPQPQGKLVRCTLGSVFDVAVDLRRSSLTFGKWIAAELSAENHQQLWIPEGFAHGFLTMSQSAEVQYKAAGYWSKNCERSIRWDDPELSIKWPLEQQLGNVIPVLAEKDANAPMLAEALLAGDVFQ
jgi:dTDP-4-dehydrorhamnose 3,5-epimerase